MANASEASEKVIELCRLPLKAGSNVEDKAGHAGTLFRTALDTVTSAPGASDLWWGRCVEDPTQLLLLIKWESMQDHQNFMKSGEFGSFIKNVSALQDGKPTILHSHLTLDGSPSAVSSPVTEHVILYLPMDVDEQDLQSKWSNFCHAITDHAEGFYGVSGNMTVEEVEHSCLAKEGEEKGRGKGFALFIGWESVEAHMKFRETDAFKKSRGAFQGAKGVEMWHYRFQKW